MRTVYVTAAAADGSPLRGPERRRSGRQGRRPAAHQSSASSRRARSCRSRSRSRSSWRPTDEVRRAVANFIDQIRDIRRARALHGRTAHRDSASTTPRRSCPSPPRSTAFPVRAVEPGDLVQALQEIARHQRSLEGRHAIVAVAMQTAQVSSMTADGVLEQLTGGRTVLYAATLAGSETSTIPHRGDVRRPPPRSRRPGQRTGTRQGLQRRHAAVGRAAPVLASGTAGLWTALERIAAELTSATSCRTRATLARTAPSRSKRRGAASPSAARCG